WLTCSGGERASAHSESDRAGVVSDDARLLNAADCVREPRSGLRHRVGDRGGPVDRGAEPLQRRRLRRCWRDARIQLLVRHCTRASTRLQAGRSLPPGPSRSPRESRHVLGVRRHLRRRRRRDVRRAVVGERAIMMRPLRNLVLAGAMFAAASRDAAASGHGPVFGAATPTLGEGGWSLDQAWTGRFGDETASDQMLKTMIGFGITEKLQISASFPEVMTTGDRLAAARMMSLMSSAREIEALVGYRFQVRPVGIGGRQESTVYVGGTIPLESRRAAAAAGPSLYVGAATGYASRSHYFWIGGGIQEFAAPGRGRPRGSPFPAHRSRF